VAIEISALAHAMKAAAPAVPVASPAADPAHVAQFRASLDSMTPTTGVDMSGAVGAPEGSVAASATTSSSTGLSGLAETAASAATGPVSLGDTILKGLEHLRDHMKAGWSSAMAPLDPQQGPMSAQGLLQMQTGVLQMGFETQMIGTIAGKTSQSIDQLVKMQ
jgi:type III secretion system YscI/HrpB-like protein